MKTFKQVRKELQALIEAIPALAGVPVLLEHEGDIDAAIETALADKGLAVAVWMVSSGTADAVRGGGVSTRVQVPVSVIENPTRCRDTENGGAGLPLEDAVHAIIAGTLGKDCGHGQVSLAGEIFARADSAAGELETVVGFEVPLIIRPA
jgi:hypothetical protein